MAIFKDQFQEKERVNTTSRSRWNAPKSDANFRAPSWAPIDSGNGLDTLIRSEPCARLAPDEQDLGAAAPSFSAFDFDDQELAIFAAKAARSGYREGQLAGRAESNSRQTQILEAIQKEIARFAMSIQLPSDAIRSELKDLLHTIIERLANPEDIEERQRLMSRAIEELLAHLDAPSPLVLRLNTDDAQRVDELLTKITDSRGDAEIRIETDPDQSPGLICVDWPGGGLERIFAGKQMALHTILDSLSPVGSENRTSPNVTENVSGDDG